MNRTRKRVDDERGGGDKKKKKKKKTKKKVYKKINLDSLVDSGAEPL